MHHHHHRRRKKRPSYGTRTVEVIRGFNGFGFTISGQQPCILSCIVANSPADQAGLRAGDFLISVNSLNVSKLPHEIVVQLIGNSFGSIRMQIAENYFSDSSDEENVIQHMGRGKPSYLHHKLKMNRIKNSAHKIRDGLGSGGETSGNNAREQHSLHPVIEDVPISVYKADSSQTEASTAHNTIPSANASASNDISNVSAMVRVSSMDNSKIGISLEYRAVVGYLGTIEMPKQIAISSKLQTVRSCIRKLRQEKRNPTTVLVTILPNCLTLQSANGAILATYSSSRLNYVSSSSESENRFFGLVTSAVHSSNMEDDEDVANGERTAVNHDVTISNSCHVFVIDTKICDHHLHEQKALEFRFTCTKDPITNVCLEFPNNSEYVVNLIRSMYTMRILPPAARNPGLQRSHEVANPPRNIREPGVRAHSPQPSNHSEVTTTSSNSDSGIGFYNDCTNISDRILVVDFPRVQVLANRFAARDPTRPLGIFNNIDQNLIAAGGSVECDAAQPNAEHRTLRSSEIVNKKLTVRAMPDPKTPPPLPNLATESNFKLIASPVSSLMTTRSCDDVLSLLDRQEENTLTASRRTFIQISVDDILINPSSQKSNDSVFLHENHNLMSPLPKEHIFLEPATFKIQTKSKIHAPALEEESHVSKDCLAGSKTINKISHKLSPKVYGVQTKATATSFENLLLSSTKRSSGPIDNTAQNHQSTRAGTDFETWTSLQNIHKSRDPPNLGLIEATFSEPDLTSRDLPSNASPFRRWGHCSFRTARYAEKQDPLANRTISLTASENDVYTKSMDTFADEFNVTQSQHYADEGQTSSGNSNLENNLQTHNTGVTGGVIAWGNSFEKLLEDPAGLHAFAEFLKKEFSAENIYFWTACERFKHIEVEADRATQAMSIFSKHLANGASEPVNVDSQARTLTEENLRTADKDLFSHAQKQIFNLMKFDSYQRFIRSDLYKRCIDAEQQSQPLPYSAEDLDELLKTNFSFVASSKLKKSASNAEDRRRKSLLPWHRKTRCKSRDRGESDAQGKSGAAICQLSVNLLKIPSTNSVSDIHSSRSSLSSFDALPQSGATLTGCPTSHDIKPCCLCRVILSDGATTIVQTRSGESVGQLIERLLDKRGITYQFFDVVINGSNKSIDLNSSAKILNGKEVLVEQRVAFKLDLPDPKVISVKSKPKKQLCEVIRPILQKYNHTMDGVQVLMRETHEQLDLSLPVTVADGKRLQIVMLKTNCNEYQNQQCKFKPMPKSVLFPAIKSIRNDTAVSVTPQQSTLDEITNKVFNELLQGKVDAHSSNQHKSSDMCSLKSEECASETSSIFDRMRKHSNIPGANRHKTKKVSKSSMSQSDETISSFTQITGAKDNSSIIVIKKPIIAKLKAGVKLQVTERAGDNQDEFLEGLKRAQCARLEDQRGTEINFELPDFLKNKENLSANKLRKVRANLNSINKPMNTNVSPITTTDEIEQSKLVDRPQPAPRLSIAAKNKTNISPMKIDQDNITHNKQLCICCNIIDANSTPSKGPPPLPPKPKVLPIKPSNWGHCNTSKTNSPTVPLPSKIPIDISRKYLGSEQSERSAYLDEPSSSFV